MTTRAISLFFAVASAAAYAFTHDESAACYASAVCAETNRYRHAIEQASPRWREVDATVLRERAVNCDLYTRRSRYPDLHAKYCAAGRCDTRALDKHFLNEGLTKQWLWGCGKTPHRATGKLRRLPHAPKANNLRRAVSRAAKVPRKAAEPNPFRVAVCFWGVNRSLNRTIASLREMIFEPLERAGAQVDVFFHTYTLAKVSSAWAREVDAVVGGPNQELKLLDEGKHRVVEWSATNQQLFDKKTNYTAYYALHEHNQHVYPKETQRNVVRAMNSLKLVTELWMATASTHARHAPGGYIPLQKGAEESGWYSHVVYARPDLRYTTPLDVALLRNLSDDELYTPDWGCWTGYNDRFAAGRPRAAAQFGMRLDLLPRIAQLPVSHPFRKRGLHAESLVRTALEASRVRPRFARAPCGARVRTSGAVSAADCEQGGTCSPLGAATFPP